MNIYAQRVLSNGALAWKTVVDSSGVAVCTQPIANLSLATVEGLGPRSHALLAWSDIRGGHDGQIYATRIGSDGAVCCGWAANGNPVCLDLTAFQAHPSLAADGNDGAIVSWLQHIGTTGTFDVYAQHIDSTGTAGALVDVPNVGSNPALAMSLAPNPVRNGTTVQLSLPEPSQLTVRVYDPSGRRIRTLVDGLASAGPVSVYWDGRSDSGEPVPPGIYLVRARTAKHSAERRLSIIR